VSTPTVAPERKATIETLLAHRAELEARGVRSLSITGSVARGDATPESDVDVLADVEPERNLWDDLRTQYYLEELLQRKIDFIPRDYRIRPRIRTQLEADAVRVF